MSRPRLEDLAKREKQQDAEEAAVGAEAREARAEIDKMRAIGGELDDLRDAYLSTSSKSKKAKLEAKADELEHRCREATSMVRIIEQRTDDQLRAKRINRAEADVRRKVAARLHRELLAESERQLQAQRMHDRDVETQVARRVRVRYTGQDGPTKSEEECRTMARVMIKGKPQDYLFLQAKAELEDAVVQYQELLELREEVSGLCQMVNHLHQLTNAQASEMDQLESAAEVNTNAINRGVRDVETARGGP
jgi:hypothetical protein